MRLMLSIASAMLGASLFHSPMPDGSLFAYGKVKDSPLPYRPSGVRAARRRAAKRRNQRRERK